MVQQTSNNFYCVGFVFLSILHMRMPDNILTFGGHRNHSCFIPDVVFANFQKLQVLRISMIESNSLNFGFICKLALSEAGLNHPLFIHLWEPDLFGMKFTNRVHTGCIKVIRIHLELVFEVSMDSLFQSLCPLLEESGFSRVEN